MELKKLRLIKNLTKFVGNTESSAPKGIWDNFSMAYAYYRYLNSV